MNPAKIALIAAAWSLLTLHFAGADYYVARTGSDRNPGTEKEPFLTIQKCAELAGAGETCFVKEGVYHERVRPRSGGRPEARITFLAEGPVVTRGFTLTAGYIRVEGFEITDTPELFPDYYGVFLEGSGYEVVNNIVHHTARDGIYASPRGSVSYSWIAHNVIRYAEGTGITIYGSDNVVEHNDISHTLNRSGGDADGIRFFGSGHELRYNSIHDITEAEAPGAHIDAFQSFDNSQPPTRNILIEGNHCYNLPHQMIIVTAATQRQSSHITIRNNLFETSVPHLGWQLILVLQVPNVSIVHNTFIGARHWAVYIGDGASNGSIKNNIFYWIPSYYHLEANSVEGFEVGHNLHFPTASPPTETNGLYRDPQFVDVIGGNYRLKPTSPAIDTAENLGVRTDKDGKPRPEGIAPDVGAYEYRALVPLERPLLGSPNN